MPAASPESDRHRRPFQVSFVKHGTGLDGFYSIYQGHLIFQKATYSDRGGNLQGWFTLPPNNINIKCTDCTKTALGRGLCALSCWRQGKGKPTGKSHNLDGSRFNLGFLFVLFWEIDFFVFRPGC